MSIVLPTRLAAEPSTASAVPTRWPMAFRSGLARLRAGLVGALPLTRSAWVDENLSLVRMLHAADKRPGEISGGMKQRIGIARALAMQPKVLLLDEPFGALDALTRAHLQDQVMEIHARLGTTVLMVTHDVDEAVLLSDRIVMMTNGPEARIGEVLEPRLRRPRDRLALAADPRFVAARKAVMEFLFARHRNPAEAA